MFEEAEGGGTDKKKKWIFIGIGTALILIFILVRRAATNSAAATSAATDPNAAAAAAAAQVPTVVDTGAYPTMDATGMDQTLSTYLAIADQNTSTQMSALNNELGTIQNQISSQNSSLQAQIAANNTLAAVQGAAATPAQPVITTTPGNTAHPDPNNITLVHYGPYATPKGGWNPNSVVDNLKQAQAVSTPAARSQYASQAGIKNYTGTAAQNVQLLKTLKVQGK